MDCASSPAVGIESLISRLLPFGSGTADREWTASNHFHPRWTHQSRYRLLTVAVAAAGAGLKELFPSWVHASFVFHFLARANLLLG